jgi:hypothetical protein
VILRSPSHRLGAVLLAVLLASSPVFGRAETHRTSLGHFVGTYENLEGGLAPVRSAGMEIRVRSPENRLTIHSNQLELTPTTQGTFRLAFEAEVEGGGHLVADIAAPGGSRRLEDQVEVRRQTVRATGEVRLERGEEGLLVTVVRPGRKVPVKIESALVGRVVGFCELLSLLPLVSMDCSGLERAMGRVEIPQPERGEQFVLPWGVLSEEERGFFEGLVPETPN